MRISSGGFDSREFGGAGRRQRSRTAHQQHAGTTAQCSFGERVSHATAGSVGEIAHGIDLFARGAGSDQIRFHQPDPAMLPKLADSGDDRFILGEASLHRSCRRQDILQPGSTIFTPRLRRISRLACVAG